MPRELRVFSITVVDLLCCALGGTLLVCFLLIVSIGRPSASGSPDAFFTASAGVWVDVTEAGFEALGDSDGWKRMMVGSGPVTSADLGRPELFETLRDACQCEVEIQL